MFMRFAFSGFRLPSLLIATALCSAAIAQVQQPIGVDTRPCIVVTGSAEARVAPDLATLSIGVTVQSKTAQDAQNQSNTQASDFIAKAKKLLGDKGTVQTGAINLYPVYSEQTMPSDRPFTPQIVAYRAENVLSIRVTDFSLVGLVIDAAVASGLNNIQSVSFGLKDDTDARMQALGDAVQQARKKAEVMARAAGVSLGAIVEISEQGARVVPFEAPMMAARSGGAPSPTPVEPGAVVVNGDVTIKFLIG